MPLKKEIAGMCEKNLCLRNLCKAAVNHCSLFTLGPLRCALLSGESGYVKKKSENFILFLKKSYNNKH